MNSLLLCPERTMLPPLFPPYLSYFSSATPVSNSCRLLEGAVPCTLEVLTLYFIWSVYSLHFCEEK